MVGNCTPPGVHRLYGIIVQRSDRLPVKTLPRSSAARPHSAGDHARHRDRRACRELRRRYARSISREREALQGRAELMINNVIAAQREVRADAVRRTAPASRKKRGPRRASARMHIVSPPNTPRRAEYFRLAHSAATLATLAVGDRQEEALHEGHGDDGARRAEGIAAA